MIDYIKRLCSRFRFERALKDCTPVPAEHTWRKMPPICGATLGRLVCQNPAGHPGECFRVWAAGGSGGGTGSAYDSTGKQGGGKLDPGQRFK